MRLNRVAMVFYSDSRISRSMACSPVTATVRAAGRVAQVVGGGWACLPSRGVRAPRLWVGRGEKKLVSPRIRTGGLGFDRVQARSGPHAFGSTVAIRVNIPLHRIKIWPSILNRRAVRGRRRGRILVVDLRSSGCCAYRFNY
jgi:hypothetical protein